VVVVKAMIERRSGGTQRCTSAPIYRQAHEIESNAIVDAVGGTQEGTWKP
jgi:hypothetical protein